MRLVIFISIFVLSFVTCIASESPAYPRVNKPPSANTIQPASKWSKRAHEGAPDPIVKIVEQADKPFIKGAGFAIARSSSAGNPVILKTYFGTTDSKAIYDELQKWQQLGLLVSFGADLTPNHHINNKYKRVHMVLNTFVPDISLDALHAAIKQTLSGWNGEMTSNLAFALDNPQEFVWRERIHYNWIATPIRFTTKNPVHDAIEEATEPFAEGFKFSIARTRYNGREVTLKTYVGASGDKQIYAECDRWRRIKRLVCTAFDPTSKGKDERFHMILDNSVPPIEEAALKTAIAKGLKANTRRPAAHYFNNPQEFTWKQYSPTIWTATPIYFPLPDTIHEAIGKAIPSSARISGFFTALTWYKGRAVTLKTYVGTTGSKAIHAECDKWQEIGLLYGTAVDLAPSHGDQRFYMILGNPVPPISLDLLHAAIEKALSGQDNDTRIHGFANPQEFAWSKQEADHHIIYTATPIHFTTQNPIHKAIEKATQPFAEGPHFTTARTMYNGRKVTLKTYLGTIGSQDIYAERDKWRRKGLLIVTAVDPTSSCLSGTQQRFYMILDNFVPPIKKEGLDLAIAEALRADNIEPMANHFNNPQEFTWKEVKKHSLTTWTATPIRFT